MRTKKDILEDRPVEVVSSNGYAPPTTQDLIVEVLIDIRDVLAKPKEEEILKIHDAIIDLATDLEEGNISTARLHAVDILKN